MNSGAGEGGAGEGESAMTARIAPVIVILSARGQAILADYGFVPVTRPAE